jgi:hypothetical protein
MSEYYDAGADAGAIVKCMDVTTRALDVPGMPTLRDCCVCAALKMVRVCRRSV